jgi:hypothetical protein
VIPELNGLCCIIIYNSTDVSRLTPSAAFIVHSIAEFIGLFRIAVSSHNCYNLLLVVGPIMSFFPVG